MGKRKERRLAAMVATSRRVKLDLCAELPGEFSDLSAHAEGGGDHESKSHTGLPNSPYSSGILEISTRILSSLVCQQLENPLLLLGQYSDDEVDEETSKGLHTTVVENSSVDLDDQVRVPSHKECEDTGISSEDLASHKANQNKTHDSSVSLDASQELNVNGTREINVTDLSPSTDMCIGVDSSEQVSVSVTSDLQVVGDVSSGWKIVLHEESNQYYYWNVVTGETSWEVPTVLAQGTDVTGGQETSADVEASVNPDVMLISSSTSEVEVDGSITKQPHNDSEGVTPNCGAKEICSFTPETESQNEEYKGDSDVVSEKTGGHDLNQADVVSSLHHGLSSDLVHSRLSSGAVLECQCFFGAASEKGPHDAKDHEECASDSDISSHLVKHGEYLLEKLKSLRGSEAHLKGDEWISKFILEVEIRLSDIKSLSLHGSFLLPFWKHSAMQLKRVAAAIKDEISVAYKPQESINNIVKTVADNKKEFSVSEIPQASNHINPLTHIQEGSTSDASKNDTVKGNNSLSYGYLTAQSCHDAVGMLEVVGIAVSAELPSKTVHHPGDDIDMDVDMEAEEPIPASNTTEDASAVQYHTLPEQSFVPNLPEEKTIENAEEFGIPPSPNEEWIPPLPPDDEPFPPPPPPDEPPESSYPQPPSDLEVAQPFSYTQYNLSYPVPNTEYYMSTSTDTYSADYDTQYNLSYPVPGNSFYAHDYEAVPNTYSAAVPAVIHTVDTAAYYGLQDGTLPPLPVVDSVDFSGFLSDSGHRSTGSDQFVSVEPLPQAGCTSLLNTNADVYGGGQTKTESTSVEAPFVPAFLQSVSTISVSANISSSASLSSTTTNVAASATEVHAKVSRSKKRTVSVVSTLRSNKKVSSLVDKWKAVEEELHENEDDNPENPSEVLEKKRQREIEKWRAQQIASGQAKENANFQPLGGDWRERVKRKQALLTNEVERSSLEGAIYGNQQPDLNELPRDLPSGWQAYWDDSSKQVYYGNAATSETTWIKPTN